MKMSARVEIDDLDFAVRDERQLVEKLCIRLKSMVKARTANGMGADGRPWQSPKDRPTQQPLQRSGQLVASVDYSKITKHRKSGQWQGNIQSKGGKRKDIKDAKALRARAKSSTEAARGAAAAAHAGSGALSRGARLTKKGSLSVSRVKRHRVISNGNLAAILSVPPQDPDGIKGNRKTYRIYEARPQEIAAAFGIVSANIKPTVTKRKGRAR